MKIIFFGSDDFALVHLEALARSEHKVVACVTQPDKPKGRGMQTVVSPIKTWALENKVPILQPDVIKDPQFIEKIKEFKSDLFVVIAYGKFLPAVLLKVPSIASLNVHGSLLPLYRGAAPINWAIINGDKTSGLSIIKMNPSMDAGDILAQKTISIDPKDTAPTLRMKMMQAGPALLLETIGLLKNNKAKFVAQDSKKITLAPKLTKELGKIDWQKPAQQIHDLVRGLKPWPGAYTFFKGKLLKILESEVIMQDISSFAPGTVAAISDRGITVVAGQKTLLVKDVHLESSKPMDALSFVRGHRLEVGFEFDK